MEDEGASADAAAADAVRRALAPLPQQSGAARRRDEVAAKIGDGALAHRRDRRAKSSSGRGHGAAHGTRATDAIRAAADGVARSGAPARSGTRGGVAAGSRRTRSRRRLGAGGQPAELDLFGGDDDDDLGDFFAAASDTPAAGAARRRAASLLFFSAEAAPSDRRRRRRRRAAAIDALFFGPPPTLVREARRARDARGDLFFGVRSARAHGAAARHGAATARRARTRTRRSSRSATTPLAVRMAGLLWKKGELDPAWKKRWFTLERSVLAWHDDERGAASGKPPKGSVDLSHEGEGYAKVEAEEGATPAGRFRFHLTPVGGGTRAFEAPSAEARDEWVKALAKARQNRKW